MKKTNYKEISRELIQMGKKDQEYRMKMVHKQSWEDLKEEILALDKIHTKKLKAILTEIGLPTISKVGKKATLCAWLIAQHTPDTKFRQEYLLLMKKHSDDVDPINLAMMQDRVNMENNKSQIYGTQFRRDKDGSFVLWKVRDRKNLDIRRKKVGLLPIDEHIKEVSKSYKITFREQNLKKGR